MKKIGLLLLISIVVCTFMVTQSFAAQQQGGRAATDQTQMGDRDMTRDQAQMGQKDMKQGQAHMNQRGGMHAGQAHALQQPVRAADLMAKNVKNPQGEQLGSIEDLVIGRDGSINYVILSHGGVLGIGDKLIPLPWEAVSTGPEEDVLIVDMDKDRLEQAPNFAKDEWPDFGERQWREKVHGYYGQREGMRTR